MLRKHKVRGKLGICCWGHGLRIVGGGKGRKKRESSDHINILS